MTPNEVLEFAKKNKVVMIDLKFMDFPGLWQHFSVPAKELSEGLFEDGLGFDGSSIRGWQAIHMSDMLVIPDPTTAALDPFTQHPTLSMICNIVDPITKEAYSRDPRYIAQKAEAYMKSTKVADTAYFGPEAEFFIFDDVRFDYTANSGYHLAGQIARRLHQILPTVRRVARTQAAGENRVWVPARSGLSKRVLVVHPGVDDHPAPAVKPEKQAEPAEEFRAPPMAVTRPLMVAGPMLLSLSPSNFVMSTGCAFPGAPSMAIARTTSRSARIVRRCMNPPFTRLFLEEKTHRDVAQHGVGTEVGANIYYVVGNCNAIEDTLE